MPRKIGNKARYREPIAYTKNSMNTYTTAASGSDARQLFTARISLLGLCALLAPWLAAFLLPAFAQPQAYHDYADQRAWLGLSHAADVLSNLPFLIVGLI